MLKLSMAGSEAILVDAASGAFDQAIQQRIWAFAKKMRGIDGIEQVVPGVNNVLVVFDSLHVSGEAVEALIRKEWAGAGLETPSAKVVDVPVHYGGALGEDLASVAQESGLSVAEVIARHSGADYSVAAVGAMPGFVYLTGLDPALAVRRRNTPRLSVPKGAVVIGGGHAGIMPCTAPSGWHILGMTDIDLFSLERADPLLLHPGDVVRFHPVEG
ncbi:5-oxoprolinase subunit PxpB [Acetobacter sp. TBRC 12305]|uniref:5-oxoprolinase subunit PxpB n=1 Tax=Acetobacter garciniae TaxID=2817435 RepID=A0A939HMP5_9PROT|nr:5-oxoprolinase subunit PxpB [Acetobacter garciniae]MBO1325770.1 5-oxoprolinase subunit PxpB [Acetobacter garciniae]MBX0345670.1 5-oxoprolinase subunit PxpB [Acetobacter garciniae]